LIWEATKLPCTIRAGGYYPDLSFEEANEMMANDPDLFKEKYKKHYADIPPQSTNMPKEPISLIMEMHFY
jgi:hypothetical protein